MLLNIDRNKRDKKYERKVIFHNVPNYSTKMNDKFFIVQYAITIRLMLSDDTFFSYLSTRKLDPLYIYINVYHSHR